MPTRGDIEALFPSIDVDEGVVSSNKGSPPITSGEGVIPSEVLSFRPTYEVQTQVQIDVQTTSSGTKNKNCTYGGITQAKQNRRYKRRPNLRENIIKALADGVPSPVICKRFKIKKSLEQYHREDALSKYYIRKQGGPNDKTKPYFYEKGVRYHIFEREIDKRVRYPQFVSNFARIHAPGGSMIRFDVLRVGDLHQIPTQAGTLTLFPKESKGDHYITELPVPGAILGYEGGKATLDFYWSNNPYFAISPPEVRMGIKGLESTPTETMFDGFIEFFREVMEQGGWKLSLTSVPRTLHYAIEMRGVRALIPELAETIHYLERGESEEELVLFADHSEKSPGKDELETTNYRLALDILALMEASL